ncbi:ABC transporter ATP-binding protein [Paenibacillus polymyxa]|uniref:ATP-binding cassette domain-containing protein n=1 Tax=Paenibacillus polymyxa TaxID=1406 RepID=UPI001BEAE612|nr:ABC transporter ATP-binding protein [Paenibacillus polymyxa]MBT2286868.1 ABC transporter ATP-binding protein [Paenibacillus polymyxa]
MKDNILLELKELYKTGKNKEILQNITFSLHQGEAIAIKGSNGAGKSTLLNVIAGLSTFNRGQRLLKNNSLIINYVHDQFPRTILTPKELLRFMGSTSGLTVSQIDSKLINLTKALRIQEDLDTPMSHFSKGMVQKINIIQALIEHTDILLLDEPLTGLDLDSQSEFIQLIKQVKNNGTAIIITSHEEYILNEISDKVLVLESGKIVSVDLIHKLNAVHFTKVHFQLPDSHILNMYEFESLEKTNNYEYYGILNSEYREKLILNIINQNGLILRVE